MKECATLIIINDNFQKLNFAMRHVSACKERKVNKGNKAFEKKGFRRNNDNMRYEGIAYLLKGVGFTIAREGSDLYLKAVKRLGLYVCATYKDSSDLEMCLEAEELILPEEPILPENPMAHQ